MTEEQAGASTSPHWAHSCHTLLPSPCHALPRTQVTGGWYPGKVLKGKDKHESKVTKEQAELQQAQEAVVAQQAQLQQLQQAVASSAAELRDLEAKVGGGVHWLADCLVGYEHHRCWCSCP